MKLIDLQIRRSLMTANLNMSFNKWWNGNMVKGEVCFWLLGFDRVIDNENENNLFVWRL